MAREVQGKQKIYYRKDVITTEQNIVIVGAGEVGRTVAQRLSAEGHNIYLVEKNETTAQRVNDELDVEVITGNGARPQVLAKAGIVTGGDVDMLIACTNRDEVNMLSCWIAHSSGVKQVIARARNLEFTDTPDWGQKLGIDAMISPERSIGREVLSLLEVSAATHAAELLDRRAALYTIKLAENSPLTGMTLKDIRPAFPELIAVFVYVVHADGASGVPDGFTQLRTGDICYVVTYKKSSWLLQELFQPRKNQSFSSQMRKIFIAGCGKIGTQIALMIRRDFGNVSLRLIDIDKNRCEQLSDEFGSSLVLNIDGADKKTLIEEGIANSDAYICATNSDELNLICCSLAKSLGAKKTIAVVKRKDYQELSSLIGVDAVADPNQALANVILKFVRFRNHALAYSLLDSINAEMLEIVLPHGLNITGKTLAQIKLPKGSIVALIGRGNDVLVPTGATDLRAGDHLILFALKSKMAETAEIFGADRP